MDPIHPISPRPPAILPVTSPRTKRVSREQRRTPDSPEDRFTKAEQDDAGEQPPEPSREAHPGEQGSAEGQRRQEDERHLEEQPLHGAEPPHIDIRA